MKFRPCIDIHEGKVKQIVGGTLDDELGAETNFIAEQDSSFFGRLYRNCNMPGGHIILLDKAGSPGYIEDVRAAELAIKEYPGGFMIGGGVTSENAADFIALGVSHVIVTTYLFKDGYINYERLEKLVNLVGKEHLVLDLSCRKKEDGNYYVVTDRWQKYTDTVVCHETLDQLKQYCDEYLIHAVDVEGKRNGVERDLIEILGTWENNIPVTYAGGISSFEDLDMIYELGKNKIDVTIGSALSIFGGDMDFKEVVLYMENRK